MKIPYFSDISVPSPDRKVQPSTKLFGFVGSLEPQTFLFKIFILGGARGLTLKISCINDISVPSPDRKVLSSTKLCDMEESLEPQKLYFKISHYAALEG